MTTWCRPYGARERLLPLDDGAKPSSLTLMRLEFLGERRRGMSSAKKSDGEKPGGGKETNSRSLTTVRQNRATGFGMTAGKRGNEKKRRSQSRVPA